MRTQRPRRAAPRKPRAWMGCASETSAPHLRPFPLWPRRRTTSSTCRGRDDYAAGMEWLRAAPVRLGKLGSASITFCTQKNPRTYVDSPSVRDLPKRLAPNSWPLLAASGVADGDWIADYLTEDDPRYR